MSFPVYFPESRETIVYNKEKHQKRVQAWQIFFIVFFLLVIGLCVVLLVLRKQSCTVNSDCPTNQACGTDNYCH